MDYNRQNNRQRRQIDFSSDPGITRERPRATGLRDEDWENDEFTNPRTGRQAAGRESFEQRHYRPEPQHAAQQPRQGYQQPAQPQSQPSYHTQMQPPDTTPAASEPEEPEKPGGLSCAILPLWPQKCVQ